MNKVLLRSLLGFCVAVTLAVVVKLGVEAYKWKKNVDERGWKADEAYGFLAQPIAPKADLSNAAALSALIQDAVQRAQAQAQNGQNVTKSGGR